MKVAINRKYKYLTFKEDCPQGLEFTEWVMQDKFETHSIVNVPDSVEKDKLRYNQFDYNEQIDTFTFNIDQYNEYLEELNKPLPPSEKERLEALEQAMLEMVIGGAE